MEHPALATVLWTWAGPTNPRVETAEYCGHKLTMRHTGIGSNPITSIHQMGFVDGKHIGTRETVPQICEMLFRYVDALEQR